MSLEVKNLYVKVEDKQVLKGVNAKFELGKNYTILGKNGSGKSTFAYALMGHPKYEITEGDILLDGESLLDLTPDERAKKGIFLAFQNIPEIPGVKLFEFLRTVYNAWKGTNETFLSFKKIIEPLLQELDIPKEFLWRDLNVGFSGGERRKVEILQLKLLNPKYIILDEVDSGLDVDAFKQVATLLQKIDSPQNTFIIITHYFTILDYIPVDRVYVFEDGKVVKEWPKELADQIRHQGFKALA